MESSHLFYAFIFNFNKSICTIIGIICITLSWLFYYNFTKHYNYWKERNVPNKRPVFPFGSTKELTLGKTYIGKAYDNLYKEFCNERFFGIIDVRNPTLVLRDPKLVECILVKNFDHFSVRSHMGNNSKEFLLKHILNVNGPRWKAMRELIAPSFTIGKMKLMYVFMEKCGKQLEKFLFETIITSSVVEITDLFARFTMDVIATCAFGLEIDSVNDSKCEFFNVVGPMLRTSKPRFIRRFLIHFFPSLVRVFPVKLIPQVVTDALTNAVRESLEYRNKHNIKRPDFIDNFLGKTIPEELRFEGEGLTIEQITAEAFVFFIAGYTTNTSTLSFCLYELARHPAIQDRLYQDVMRAVVNNEGDINHQALLEMEYVDQAIYETLRLYGSGQILTRICTKTFKIPNSSTIVEPGIRVVIPTYSIHHDPQYFPDPYIFDPDRFSTEHMKKRSPYVYIPFGVGPRGCLAKKFGMLQIKIGIATVIANFHVTLSSRQNCPVEIDKRSIVITPEGPIYLTFTTRNRYNK